jgi:hypothetical protein
MDKFEVQQNSTNLVCPLFFYVCNFVYAELRIFINENLMILFHVLSVGCGNGN